MIKNAEINIFPSSHDLFDFAATDFMQRAMSAVREKGLFSVVLSGGNTAKTFFDTLSNVDKYKAIPWQNIQFFFGDERYVPSTDKDNNYHLSCEHLFSKVPIDANKLYPIPTEWTNPQDAAKQYADTLRQVFDLNQSSFPPFDLIYLGLGENAHTASLMPQSSLVKQYAEVTTIPHKEDPLVASLWLEQSKSYRITLTPPAINHGLNIIFLVTGANKAMAVKQVLNEPSNPEQYPAQLIHSVDGNTIWYLDSDAAIELKQY